MHNPMQEKLENRPVIWYKNNNLVLSSSPGEHISSLGEIVYTYETRSVILPFATQNSNPKTPKLPKIDTYTIITY